MAAILRSPEPGDFGWVVHRHGALYSTEHGYDWKFEALVAEIVAKFIREYRPESDRCWIAEVDGEKAGSVFLVDQGDETAKLRLLLVEPLARGKGMGKMLVDACIAFARERGYKKIVLWTESELNAARQLYQSAGFKRISGEPHELFGKPQIGETWELILSIKSDPGKS